MCLIADATWHRKEQLCHSSVGPNYLKRAPAKAIHGCGVPAPVHGSEETLESLPIKELSVEILTLISLPPLLSYSASVDKYPRLSPFHPLSPDHVCPDKAIPQAVYWSEHV